MTNKNKDMLTLCKEREPFFSIIMPVYNKAPYIRDTISSILNQTYSSYEIIMIGGASTDDTDIICQEYATENPETFRYITQSGKGVSTARNDGILSAKGKYIAFLDADDIWIPEYLETMKKLIDDYPDAVFYAGGHTWKYPDGVETSRVLPISRGYINYPKVSIDYNGLGILNSWIIYDRKTVINAGLFKTDYTIGEDADLAVRMALSGKVAYEPKNLGTYMAELPESLCKYSSGFEVLVPGEPELYTVEQKPEIVKYHDWLIINVALQNIVRGYPKTARKQLRKITNKRNKKVKLFTTLSYFPTHISSFIHSSYNKYFWRKQ